MNDSISNGNSAGNVCRCESSKCGCTHHKMVPIFIILIALTFLAGTFNVLDAMQVSIVWPILVILAAGTKMFSHKCTCC